MSNIIPVLLFFIYIWCFGFTTLSIFKLRKNSIEHHILMLGIGLGIMPIVGVIFNLIHIPIAWWSYLILCVPYPLYTGFKAIRKGVKRESKEKKPITIPWSLILIAGVIAMSLIMSIVYTKGALSYPYLEDGDSYRHLAESYKISKEGTYSWIEKPFLSVEEPYPHGYHLIIAPLLQSTTSWQSMIKIINAIIVSLSIIFFYLFIKKWTKNEIMAFFCAFCLFVIPSFMTHFIWGTSLALTLFFPALYCIVSSKKSYKWKWLAGLMMGSILISQVSNSFNFVLLFIVIMGLSLLKDRTYFKRLFVAGIIAVMVAMLFYFPAYLHSGSLSRFAMRFGFGEGDNIYFSPTMHGGDTLYTLNDFIFTPSTGKIDNSIGIGPILLLLSLGGVSIAMGMKKKKSWQKISVGWLAIGLLLTLSGYLPISFFPHRAWSTLAIPVCIFAGFAFYLLWKWLPKTKFNRYLVISVLLLFILSTSGYSKYKINTSIWPWGATIKPDPEEMKNYIFLNTLPPGTRVIPICTAPYLPIGFDKDIDYWNEEIFMRSVISSKGLGPQWEEEYNNTKRLWEMNATEIYSWFKEHNFDYALADGNCVDKLGEDKVNDKVNEWLSTGSYDMVFNTARGFVIKIK